MNTVTVRASKTYDIKIGPGLLQTLGQEVAALGGVERVCIVSDSHVYPLFGKTAEKCLKDSGFIPSSFVFPAGEEQKNGTVFLELLNTLARHQLTRSDLVVALGGGVIGDLAGFAASCYLRGIRFVQIPTTLLAAVDSSVGGKCAIDLDAGKNLAGAFYQPSAVLCDTDTLSTLPATVFADGCAEIIKYGVLFDEALFSQLEQEGLDFQREKVIARCVELKRNVVEEDEFDTGKRQLLNLGHTIGHAIEKESHYRISHGHGVAIGMCIIAKAAAAHRECEALAVQRLHDLLSRFTLPTSATATAQALMVHIRSDKKCSDSRITLVLPATIGCCQLKKLPISQLETYIKAGM